MLRYILAGGTLAFLLLLFSCRELPTREEATLAEFPKEISAAPKVRVLMKNDADEIRMEIKGRFHLTSSDGRTIPNRNVSLAEVVVKAARGGLAIGVIEFPSPAITVTPEIPGTMYIDGVRWPGEVTFRRTGTPLRFDVINTLNIEEYLCGVLAAETPWRTWPSETLKAQAVASRTYAYHSTLVARRKGEPYDLFSDQNSQIFTAGMVDQPIISRAVNATRGQILTYQGKIFPAYFSAVCGGATEDASKVFGDVKTAPLSGTNCPYCEHGGSKYDSWTVEIRTDEITNKLRAVVSQLLGKQLGQVRMVEPAKTGVSSRVTTVRIVNALEPVELNANTFRRAMGTSRLPSTFFTVQKAGAGVLRFSGKGWGHGVGMCQFGAAGMGRAGWTYVEILSWYYKGARLSLLPYAAGEVSPGPLPADDAAPARTGLQVK